MSEGWGRGQWDLGGSPAPQCGFAVGRHPPSSHPSREEKAEQLLDSQAEVQGLEAEIRRLRQEVRSNVSPPPPAIVPCPSWSYCFLRSLTPLSRSSLILVPHHMAQTQALSGQAKRAELYREEAEALRERAGRLPRLQEELRRCREKLHAAEVFKGQLEVRWGWGRRAGPEAEYFGGRGQGRGVQKGSGQEKSGSSFTLETVIAG